MNTMRNVAGTLLQTFMYNPKASLDAKFGNFFIQSLVGRAVAPLFLVLHEGGHVIAAEILYKNASSKIEVIALCGSSQRMMQGAILEASAPLYGRAQEIIKLNPIPIGYMGEALDLDSLRRIFENYSIWGGIPRYWELVKNSKGTLLDIINDLVLDRWVL